MSYIVFKDVCKFYKTGSQKIVALDNMSFEIQRGEFCVIVGPSGAGKTTLIELLEDKLHQLCKLIIGQHKFRLGFV